ncbi:unnamed protein product [Orchesella dallaii]|uniref:Uncharacterized protein n=1 Tax=Orchesella dallaii TaxID=48710 RepID=A0ABP1PK76_9HEXA
MNTEERNKQIKAVASSAAVPGTVSISPPPPLTFKIFSDELQLAFRTVANKEATEQKLNARTKK